MLVSKHPSRCPSGCHGVFTPPAALIGAVLLAITPLAAKAQDEPLGAYAQARFSDGTGRTDTGFAGTLLGGEIGRSMDRLDWRWIQHTLEASRTGQSVNWTNPASGIEFTVTPIRTFRSARFGDCRHYQAWVFIGGYEREVRGIACRRPDGIWRTVRS